MASKVNRADDKYRDATGRVFSFSSHYGFIDVPQSSIKARVYFDARSFEDNRHDDLHASGLKVGDRVILDFGPRPDTSMYRAWRVCREGYSSQRHAEKLPPRFDDEQGVICVLKDSHAFVRLPRFRGVTASFQKSDFENYAGRRVVTLTDVLKHGLEVRFDAQRNPDERSKTKWLVERLRFIDGVAPSHAAVAVHSSSSEDNCNVQLVRRHGSVEKVSTDHAIVRHQSGTAYLHASVVEKCLGVDVQDLREALEEGGDVRFDADDNGRQYGRGRWCVTRVEILGLSSDTSRPLTAQGPPARRLRTGAGASDAPADAELYELQLEPRLHIDENKQDYGEAEGIWDDPTGTCVAQNVSDDERAQVPPLVSREEFPCLPSQVEPSVSIYQDVPAVLASVAANSASCFVEQPDGTRTVKFAARCFYRDGVPVSGNLRRALGGGDSVTLDFMVGTTRDGVEVVHCDLAWQGKKPRDVPRMSAEEMLARLDVVGEGEDEDAVDPDDQFLLETIDDEDLNELLGESLLGESSSTADDDQGDVTPTPLCESSSTPDDDGVAEVDTAPTRRWRIRDDVRETGTRAMTPPQNGERGPTNEEAFRYLLTSNEVPAFARMILQQLAASHLPNSRVRLRHASTQTE